MSFFPVSQTFSKFDDLNGDSLEAGYVYIGQPNQNPQTDPIPIFWDLSGTIPAAQPLRTVNGYLSRNGTPANIFINTDYSISVYDSRRNLVFTVASALAAGAELPIFVDPIAPTYLKTISDILNGLEVSLFRFIDPSIYSAIRAGTNTDDLSVNINDAFSSDAKKIFVPYGTYNFSTTLNIVNDGFGIRGEGVNATIFKINTTNTNAITCADGLTGINLENFRVTRSGTAIAGGNGIDFSNSLVNQGFINQVVTDNHYIGINLGEAFDSKIKNILSYHNQLNGIQIIAELLTGNNCEWQLEDCSSRNNNGQGINVLNNSASLPMILGLWSNVSASYNKDFGVYIYGPSLSNSINDFLWNGGKIIGNGGGGVFLNTNGISQNITGVTVEFSGQSACGVNGSTPSTGIGNGFLLTGANESANFVGCTSNKNSYWGYYLGTLTGGQIALTGCTGLDNHQNIASGLVRSAIYFDNPGSIGQILMVNGGFYGNSSASTTTLQGIAGINGSGVVVIGASLNAALDFNFAFGVGFTTMLGYKPGGFSGPFPNQIGNLVVGIPTGGLIVNGINSNQNIAKNGSIYINP